MVGAYRDGRGSRLLLLWIGGGRIRFCGGAHETKRASAKEKGRMESICIMPDVFLHKGIHFILSTLSLTFSDGIIMLRRAQPFFSSTSRKEMATAEYQKVR